MDDHSEIKKLLLRDIKLSEENNKILKKMRRSILWGTVFKFFYVIVIVGSAFGAYYFLQPYLSSLQEIYGSVFQNIDTIQGLFDREGAR